jgi:hypothetical protein
MLLIWASEIVPLEEKQNFTPVQLFLREILADHAESNFHLISRPL